MRSTAWILSCLIIGCGVKSHPEVGGETNWLVLCAEDGDCSDGECNCGMCTRTCDDASDCQAAHEGVCVDIETDADGASCDQALCVPRCGSNEGCGDGFECVGGGCTPAASGDTSGAGGTSGSTGGTGGVVATPTICPASAPNGSDACDVPQGTSCTWVDDGAGWTRCGCYADASGQALWACSACSGCNCPARQPETGDSCADYPGATPCPYDAHGYCSCSPALTWECSAAPGAVGGAGGWGGSGGTDGATASLVTTPAVDGTVRVGDLDAEQMRVWCEWYVDAYSDDAAPAEVPPVDGLASPSYATSSCGDFYAQGCLVNVPVEQCIANLMLGDCRATVADLNDCVLTILDRCTPHEVGCGPYRSQSSCDTTIAVADGCRLALE